MLHLLPISCFVHLFSLLSLNLCMEVQFRNTVSALGSTYQTCTDLVRDDCCVPVKLSLKKPGPTWTLFSANEVTVTFFLGWDPVGNEANVYTYPNLQCSGTPAVRKALPPFAPGQLQQVWSPSGLERKVSSFYYGRASSRNDRVVYPDFLGYRGLRYMRDRSLPNLVYKEIEAAASGNLLYGEPNDPIPCELQNQHSCTFKRFADRSSDSR